MRAQHARSSVPVPSGDVCDLMVQPYWLQATTANAPWIPTGYSGNLPWCITWHVTGTTAGGSTVGVAGRPASASGTIRHGGDNEKDTYTLAAGHMAWLNADGSETPMPHDGRSVRPLKGRVGFS